MKHKSVDDEGILVNNKRIHVDDKGTGTEYYKQKLFNKTRTRPIIKSITLIKFVTIYLIVFSTKKKCIFGEKCGKPFLRVKYFLKGRGRLATKMNTTFFMRNAVLNIFFI